MVPDKTTDDNLPDLHNRAADPATPAEQLRTLSRHADPSVRAAVAANPNTPPDLLLTLAGDYPAQFCTNPIFPLLLIENPNLPFDMDPASLGRLLAYAGTPPDFLAYVAAYGSPEAAAAARLHVNLAGEAGPDWPDQTAAAIRRMAVAPEGPLLRELLGLDAVPPWLFERLADSDDPLVTATIARHPAAPPALRRRLSDTQTPATPPLPATSEAPLNRAAPPIYPPDSPLAHAADPTTPPDELARLAEDEDPRVRVAVARNPTSPPDLLRKMKDAEDWSDADVAVYQALAANPNTPPDLLERFAADQSALYTGVRRAVAHNPQAPAAALEHLADELFAADIRQTLVTHPNLPPALRERILTNTLVACLRSGDPFYHAIALAHPALTTAPAATAATWSDLMAPDADPLDVALSQVVLGGLFTPQATVTDLESGARSPVWLERCAVARNPGAPQQLLAALADDGNRLVRAAAQARLAP